MYAYSRSQRSRAVSEVLAFPLHIFCHKCRVGTADPPPLPRLRLVIGMIRSRRRAPQAGLQRIL